MAFRMFKQFSIFFLLFFINTFKKVADIECSMQIMQLCFFFEQKKIEAPLKNSERVIEKEEVQRVLFDK